MCWYWLLGYKSKPSMVISRSLLVPSSFTTCAFLVCWDASYGPGYLITEGHVQVTFECLIWELFLGGSSAIFTLAKFLKWTWESYGILMCAFQLVRARSFGKLRESEHCWNCNLQDSDILQEVQPAKLSVVTHGLLMDHLSRLEFGILDVLVTWPCFSMDKLNWYIF
jgi:hypothetical protein